jgi:hypothetical protein
MKQSIEHAPSQSGESQNVVRERNPQRTPSTDPHSGHLTQLAAIMNGSPQAHALAEMSAWMNPATSTSAPVQRAAINNDPALKHEADDMDASALRMAHSHPVVSRQASHEPAPAQRQIVQREGGGIGDLVPDRGEHFLLIDQEEEGRARDFQDWTAQLQALQQQHVLNQQAVYAVINSPVDIMNVAQVPDLGLPVEAILANTKEFISQRLVVIAMTPTLTTRLKPPREFERFWPPVPAEARKGELFFDDNTGYPTTGSNKKAAEGLNKADAGVLVRDSNETAHADGMNIRVFMDEQLNQEVLKRVLIHEIQHVVDRHSGDFQEAVMNDINGEAGDVANQYRTEFRAYWLGDRGHGGFGDPAQPARNNRSVVEKWWIFNWKAQATNFGNERQENIFWHLATSGPYPWIKPNYLQSGAFRTLVNNLTSPTGANLINSIRIDALRSTLSLAAPGFAYYTQDAIDEAQALDLFDFMYLRSPRAARFWTFFDSKFNGPFTDNEHRDRVALIKAHLEEIIGRP